ncbi:MAG TPA: RecQ family ATP-dependent DNA helicase [Candidatus Eisenbacteria bacterium]|nr:RecQ family ATP-dependent DNA helicase [Candidatus Eisenbacteria bacterium]
MPSPSPQPVTASRFLHPLQRFWGYSTFRPRQEEIVHALDSGRDVCVVMPTGGGKSLCYQLPAVLDEKHTAVVISPLIALMQDQVAQLRQMGIPAVFLNSAVLQSEQRELKQKAVAGDYRLIYVSPERAVMEATERWLKSVPVSFFAIDEAHCISQWGHDFRPEYRQLAKLRSLLPDRPIAAFTASATQQVRHDIVEQLQLRDPLKSVSSFRRENLRYIVRQAKDQEQDALVLEAVRRVREGNVIVYCPTVARVGELVDALEESGIPAVGYHGQMDAAARRDHQEKWMSEEARVLVGTIAFGLGINKPNVRAVIRLGLPDSLEQFYQETGRAGRDALPADCYLFWQKKDNALRAFFINQIGDQQEKDRAWQRYYRMQDFVSSRDCRQKTICEHFGESPKWPGCGICDVCVVPPAWVSGSRAPLTVPSPAAGRTGVVAECGPAAVESEAGADAELREFLREWRRKIARENCIAAFHVLHDSTLENICVQKPQDILQLRQVSGMGEAKCDAYGGRIVDVLRRFANGERASQEWHARSSSPSQETVEFLQQGRTFEEIAQLRGRKVSTVVSLVAALIEKGEIAPRPDWVHPIHAEQIRQTAERLGLDLLKPIKEALPEEVSYDEIRLVVSQLRHNAKCVTR